MELYERCKNKLQTDCKYLQDQIIDYDEPTQKLVVKANKEELIGKYEFELKAHLNNGISIKTA